MDRQDLSPAGAPSEPDKRSVAQELPASSTGASRAASRAAGRAAGRQVEGGLDLIAEVGVAGVSHRKVAVVADLPLGSMTYHFDGMDELLRLAFGRFSRSVSDGFEQRMSGATDLASARAAVVEIITQDPPGPGHRGAAAGDGDGGGSPDHGGSGNIGTTRVLSLV